MKHAQNVFKDGFIMFQMDNACSHNATTMLTKITTVTTVIIATQVQLTMSTHAKIAPINAFNVPIQHGVITAQLDHIQ